MNGGRDEQWSHFGECGEIGLPSPYTASITAMTAGIKKCMCIDSNKARVRVIVSEEASVLKHVVVEGECPIRLHRSVTADLPIAHEILKKSIFRVLCQTVSLF